MSRDRHSEPHTPDARSVKGALAKPMLAEPDHAHAFRILGLFPHPRHVGHVVLDEGGLVVRSFFSTRTRRLPELSARLESLEQLIRRSIARYCPTIIVIVRGRASERLDAMVAHAITVAEKTALPVHIRCEDVLHDLFVDEDAGDFDQLGQSITTVFFPELAGGVTSWGRGSADRRRRPRAIWKAAAGALAVLAETRPASVVALARSPLPHGLASFIARVSHEPV